MPVIVRELIIRAVVEEERGPDVAAAERTTPQTERVVEECVDQVMDILREREAR